MFWLLIGPLKSINILRTKQSTLNILFKIKEDIVVDEFTLITLGKVKISIVLELGLKTR